jgi:hypothetical protein
MTKKTKVLATCKNHAYKLYDAGEITLNDLKNYVTYFALYPDQDVDTGDY